MKKVLWLGAVVLFLGSAVIAFSQGMAGKVSQPATDKKEAVGSEDEAMEHQQAPEGTAMPEKMAGMSYKHEMMKMMMTRSMVASNDGGVIVMMGNKLMKYDKDLNLLKEAEIKVDIKAMMEKMKAGCPMMSEKKDEINKPESPQWKREAPKQTGAK
jgi:hypothetical protein